MNTPTQIDVFDILRKYYSPASEAYSILLTHSVLVTAKALNSARNYLRKHPGERIDLKFIQEAAMLHDIGIFKCHAPEIGCHGSEPYFRHIVIGREILEAEGLPKHALVCERHTGAGLTKEEIAEQGLSLPARDMLPVSLEEKAICFADRFFVKDKSSLMYELAMPEIESKLAQYGRTVLNRWQELKQTFL